MLFIFVGFEKKACPLTWPHRFPIFQGMNTELNPSVQIQHVNRQPCTTSVPPTSVCGASLRLAEQASPHNLLNSQWRTSRCPGCQAGTRQKCLEYFFFLSLFFVPLGGGGEGRVKTSTYFINWGSVLVIFINHSHCTFHCSRCQFGFWCQEGREAISAINMTDSDHEIFCPSLSALEHNSKLNVKKNKTKL